MPKRALIPAKWAIRHVQEHPGRLAATALILLMLSFVVLGWAMTSNYRASRLSRVDNCKATNELSRKIYVTLADFGTPQHVRQKFLPTKNCEAIP